MSCKNIARGVFDSPTPAGVTKNGIIPLTSFNSTTNCIRNQNGEVTVNDGGNYIVAVNVTLAALAAGVHEVQLFRNGSPVPGAHAFETIAAIGDLANFAFDAPITVDCCGDTILSARLLAPAPAAAGDPAANVRVHAMTIEEA